MQILLCLGVATIYMHLYLCVTATNMHLHLGYARANTLALKSSDNLKNVSNSQRQEVDEFQKMQGRTVNRLTEKYKRTPAFIEDKLTQEKGYHR